MKYFILISLLALSFSSIRASAFSFSESPIITNFIADGTRIEIINEHAFFILSLPKTSAINYGDKVELTFGLNTKITVYNISGKDVHTFTNLGINQARLLTTKIRN